MAVDLKTLEKLLALAKKHKLSELEVEDGKSKFRIRTALGARVVAEAPAWSGDEAPAYSAPSAASAADRSPPTEAPKKPPASSGADDRRTKVLSPFVGTFYRAPSPEAD